VLCLGGKEESGCADGDWAVGAVGLGDRGLVVEGVVGRWTDDEPEASGAEVATWIVGEVAVVRLQGSDYNSIAC
jgi:hypothetical protein